MVSTRDARLSRLSDSASGLEALGVPSSGGALYELALTHRSFAFEQPEQVAHNERLEFLGDAVVGLVAAELLYLDYPELPEGDLARLRASIVNTVALADLARSLGVGEHIRLGRGEETSGGRDKDSLLADTFEAIVGALYLDRGLDAVRASLTNLLKPRIHEAVLLGDRYDAKTTLQELVVREVGGFPSYRLASSGPDHDKTFMAEVYVGGVLYGAGTGRSKKEAEQSAAREALDRFESDVAGGLDAGAS